MSYFEVKFIPLDNSTRGKYRYYDIVYYSVIKKPDEVKAEYQKLLRTKNVKIIKRSGI